MHNKCNRSRLDFHLSVEKYYAISSQIMLTYIAIGKYERTLFPEGKLCPHNKKMQLQI